MGRDLAKVIISLAESLSKDLLSSDGSQYCLKTLRAYDFCSIANLAISHLKQLIEGKNSADSQHLLEAT